MSSSRIGGVRQLSGRRDFETSPQARNDWQHCPPALGHRLGCRILINRKVSSIRSTSARPSRDEFGSKEVFNGAHKTWLITLSRKLPRAFAHRKCDRNATVIE